MEQFIGAGNYARHVHTIKSTVSTMEKELARILNAEHTLLSKVNAYLAHSGGKRLRPFLILLGAELGEKEKDPMPLALAIETVHMATLVHDDVVDHAMLRRGKPTVKAKWGNEISVFSGNYILSKAMSLMAGYHDAYLNHRIAKIAMEMCCGELDQMNRTFQISDDLDGYLTRIKQKTAFLLSASCELGAYISSAPREIVDALIRYGEAIGIAFQITDDMLDYQLDTKDFGKISGGDIREGIATLPLMYATQHCTEKDRLYEIFAKPRKSDAEVKEVISLVTDCGGVEYAKSFARQYIDKAKRSISILPQGKIKEVYFKLADFIVTRNQ